MTNYKPLSIQNISILGLETPVPGSAKLKHLYDNTQLSNAADTMLDVETNTNYRPPSTETFTLIGIKINYAGTAQLAVWNGDATDALDTIHGTTPAHTIVKTTDWFVGEWPPWIGQTYVTIKPNFAQINDIHMWGFETHT